jgi:2-methylcitrate dehydratase PrpD
MLDKIPATPGATLALADAMATLAYADLPKLVVAKAKGLLLDCLGNIVRGSLESPAQALASVFVHQGGAGEASAVATPKLLPAAHAGFVNGVSAHCAGFDAAPCGALTRIGAAVIPAALAMGEAVAADGKAFIAAIAAGYETTIRIGLAVDPDHAPCGHHWGDVIGVFGAVTAAGKLLGLDGAGLAHAYGVAGALACGPAALSDPAATAEPLGAGKAVYDGILSAQLVREGFADSLDIIENRQRFARLFSDETRLEQLTRGLGRDYRLLEIADNPRRSVPSAAEAVAEIARKAGVRASDADTGARELQDKWHATVDALIGERRAGDIADLVAGCETLPTLDVLTAMLPTMARAVV